MRNKKELLDFLSSSFFVCVGVGARNKPSPEGKETAIAVEGDLRAKRCGCPFVCNLRAR